MDEKVLARVGGASLMGVPILYAGFLWAGRIGKPAEINWLLTAGGVLLFGFGAFAFYLGSRSE